MKSPAFQFYPNDFLGGVVATYSLEEIGLYMSLLAFDWNLNGLPLDVEKLAKMSRVSARKFRVLWKVVGENFTERDGRYHNPRLDLERAKQDENRAKKKAAADSRWNAGAHADALQVQCSPSSTPSSTPVKATTSPRKAAAVKKLASAPTWLTPYLLAWKQQYDGDMAVEPNVTPLKWLEERHGPTETLRRWVVYLAGTSSKFANAAKLKAGWGEYAATMQITIRPPGRGAVLLDLCRRYDLFAYNGNTEEYEAKLVSASADPQAGPTFRTEARAVKPWAGLPGENDHFKSLEIERRLSRQAAEAVPA